MTEKACENQTCLEEALVILKEQLLDQDEYVVQAANVSQPIEYAVGLPSCRFNFVSGYELSVCKGIETLRINIQIWNCLAFSELLFRIDIQEVCRLLLSILEPISLILDRVHAHLNNLLLILTFRGLVYF